MSTYRVLWEIDVEAEAVEEAARFALEIQRDPASIATVFEVRPDDDAPVRIDAAEIA